MNRATSIGKLTRSTLLILVVALILGGCVTLDRRELARDVASDGGFQSEIIKTVHFDLQSYYRFNNTKKVVTIYLEGDGFAWMNRHTLSKDPTPRNPVALRLATIDPAANVAYIGRPCQYVQKSQRRNCNSGYWSKARFANEVVVATNQAIEQLKKKARASSVHLVGYSGGGGVAALVAARREDVESIRTVAGNLDHVTFTSHHKVTPLSDSLNPMDEAQKIDKIAQIHFSGSRDKIVPTYIADGFVAAQRAKACSKVVSVAGMAHGGEWEKAWPEMLQLSLPKCNITNSKEQ
ncbi:MAG: alpha/beta hydrolase [Magnetococcales bacterium]|nr:alpha/beta hydrolase [Magnetococcales bacterium]